MKEIRDPEECPRESKDITEVLLWKTLLRKPWKRSCAQVVQTNLEASTGAAIVTTFKHFGCFNVSPSIRKMSVFPECSLNYPRWLSTVKGFPNAVITAHSDSIYQQAKAITASIDFDYWLYAWMTSNLSLVLLHTTREKRRFSDLLTFVTCPFFTCSMINLLSTSNV